MDFPLSSFDDSIFPNPKVPRVKNPRKDGYFALESPDSDGINCELPERMTNSNRQWCPSGIIYDSDSYHNLMEKLNKQKIRLASIEGTNPLNDDKIKKFLVWFQ